MNIKGLFEYDENVTLEYFMQWLRVNFNHVQTISIYYLDKLENWEKRVKIDTNEKLRLYLAIVSSDLTLQSYIMVSIEEASPSNTPCKNDDGTISTLSSPTRGSVQSNFHQRVLTRDGSCCVFCGVNNKAHLGAAHIFDVFRAEDIPDNDVTFLQQYEIIDLYDTSNGITLCNECHNVFDALLCCVRVEERDSIVTHKIVVATALKDSPEFADKWTALDGADVRVPMKPLLLKHWPPQELFQFRELKFDEYAVKRQQLKQDLPNVCKCGKITKSVAGLARHMQSKTCLERATSMSNKLSTLCTPSHPTTTGEKRRKKQKKIIRKESS